MICEAIRLNYICNDATTGLAKRLAESKTHDYTLYIRTSRRGFIGTFPSGGGLIDDCFTTPQIGREFIALLVLFLAACLTGKPSSSVSWSRERSTSSTDSIGLQANPIVDTATYSTRCATTWYLLHSHSRNKKSLWRLLHCSVTVMIYVILLWLNYIEPLNILFS